jgi:hypothetical protein
LALQCQDQSFQTLQSFGLELLLEHPEFDACRIHFRFQAGLLGFEFLELGPSSVQLLFKFANAVAGRARRGWLALDSSWREQQTDSESEEKTATRNARHDWPPEKGRQLHTKLPQMDHLAFFFSVLPISSTPRSVGTEA